MKTKYTLEELYAIMYKNGLQNVTFEDGLASINKLEKVKAVESKDAAPMIGLNPFKQKEKKEETSKRTDRFNDLLNHRVSNFIEKAAD